MTAAGRRVQVIPQLKVEQGIQAARTIFGKCYFDAEKCADSIQALRHYRYEGG
jgi:phage terminase large subunit